MYLHLGGETVVKVSEVVAILNLENLSIASAQTFLKKSIETRDNLNKDQDEPKSLIITNDKVYTSPISSFTLMKRAAYLSDVTKTD
ncbi:MAG TPA: extracellular matrix/biofilm biosynthesis regulator RemA family protein [Bacillota bacterium]|nr:extracellular matrix/biofilm biosynthesis regulator RemA family protein [Bacillota bacterium]